MKPVALIFGTTPGWACECQWSTMERKEFKAMFGFKFLPRKFAGSPNVFVIRGGVYSGNSQQRRKQRRESIRKLRAEQMELAGSDGPEA